MPLHMRIPKLEGLQQPVPGRVPGHQPRHHRGSGLDEVTPTSLHGQGPDPQGCPGQGARPGRAHPGGTVEAHAFSKAAEAAITAAGGTVEILPKPWGDRRPPAKGNQFTNR